MQIQKYFIVTTLAPRVGNCLFELIDRQWGNHGAKQVWIKILYFSFAFTQSVKSLGLISVMTLLGLLNLGSTLALTPCVKGA
jgi:hypothetical protein